MNQSKDLWRQTCRLLSLLFWMTLGVVANAQEVGRAMRQQFLFMPAFRDCGPAEVRGFGLGVHPPNALLAQLYVTSRSEKAIVAVKLGWKVYEWKQGGRIAANPCEVNVTPLQSGQSEFIDVQGLRTKETIIVGTSPLPVSDPGKRVVFVS